MKNKPLMISALIFGGIGVLIILFAVICYMSGNTEVYESIGRIFGMTRDKITTASLSQFGIIFEAAAFVLGYRSLKDEVR